MIQDESSFSDGTDSTYHSEILGSKSARLIWSNSPRTALLPTSAEEVNPTKSFTHFLYQWFTSATTEPNSTSSSSMIAPTVENGYARNACFIHNRDSNGP